MLDFIKNDHRNMKILLDVLQQKVVALRNEQPVRYALIRDIVEYLKTYSGKYHHPYEDIIYDYYLAHKTQQNKAINHLESEHEAIAEATDELCSTIEMILLDAIVPLEQFVDQLDEYVRQQLRHMKFEDEQIIPALERELTDDDWKTITDSLPHDSLREGLSIDELMYQLDPLFGQEVAERYKALHEVLQQSE